ncbi:MAG: zf-HC2 domain-containing protein [Pseudomonadota bacterium]
MSDKPHSEENERLIALMGLAASQQQGTGNCPSSEQLAAFVDGSLMGETRQRMLAHLNRCPQCYFQWLEIGAYLKEAAPVTKSRSAWLAKLGQRFNLTFASWRVAIPLAAALALVSIVLLWPTTPNLNQRISQGYILFSTQDSSRVALILEDLPLPWESAVLGFNEVQLTPARQAFGAGLWSGKCALFADRAGLLPERLFPPAGRPWADTDWKQYYELGRWMVLVWVQVHPARTPQDLTSHQATLEILHSEFKKRTALDESANESIEALAHLRPLLDNAARQGDHHAYQDLSRNLLIMMQKLGPSSL